MTVACWVCLCGADNQATAEVCFRCGATRPSAVVDTATDEGPSPPPAISNGAEEPAPPQRTGLPATAVLGLGILLLVAGVLAAWIFFRPTGAQEPPRPQQGRSPIIGAPAATARP